MINTKPHLSHQLLLTLIEYDPDTGKFYRTAGRSGRGKPREITVVPHTDGHVYFHVDGRRYAAHHLAWFYTTGTWPPQNIDHVNGVPGDNRMANIRLATQAQNMQNQRRPRSHNTSGFLGVAWRKQQGKWGAKIGIDGKQLWLGFYDTPEAAHESYLAAKRKLHSHCTI